MHRKGKKVALKALEKKVENMHKKEGSAMKKEMSAHKAEGKLMKKACRGK